MPTTATKPTEATSKLIVPEEAYYALQKLARSKRLAAKPSLMLVNTFQSNGIFFAGWIPSKDYEHVKTLYIPIHTFDQLKYIQSKLNVEMYNFTLMDIVVANLVILRELRLGGEMIGVVQERGISPVVPGDILQHYIIQSNEIDWMPTA